MKFKKTILYYVQIYNDLSYRENIIQLEAFDLLYSITYARETSLTYYTYRQDRKKYSKTQIPRQSSI